MVYYAIVRGPLGIGKTTVVRRLAEQVRGVPISIDTILDGHGLDEWEEGFMSRRVFLQANRFAIEEAVPALTRGIPVFFDGNFYWKSQIRDLLERLPFDHLVVSLTAPVDLCILRDSLRTPSYGEQATREVYAHTTRFDWGVAVDASGPVERTVDTILAHLTSLGLAGAEAGSTGAEG